MNSEFKKELAQFIKATNKRNSKYLYRLSGVTILTVEDLRDLMILLEKYLPSS